MLARVDGPDGEFVAVHRTWLRPDGRKAELQWPKKSMGLIRGAAVRLAPAAPLLVVGEGIENALTVIVATGLPAWSAVSKSGFEGLLLPAEVREVVIVADHDANGGGELAARRAGERWAAEGRRVRLALPPEQGQDANDLLRGKRGKACRPTASKR
jgi:putative DNA primase/helicase